MVGEKPITLSEIPAEDIEDSDEHMGIGDKRIISEWEGTKNSRNACKVNIVEFQRLEEVEDDDDEGEEDDEEEESLSNIELDEYLDFSK